MLQQIKGEMDQLVKQMDINIDEIKNSAKAFQASEMANLTRIAEVYSKMDPNNAASLLRQMERERAAKILKLISERKAAAILDASVAEGDEGADAAAEWSDMLRKLKELDTEKT